MAIPVSLSIGSINRARKYRFYLSNCGSPHMGVRRVRRPESSPQLQSPLSELIHFPRIRPVQPAGEHILKLEREFPCTTIGTIRCKDKTEIDDEDSAPGRKSNNEANNPVSTPVAQLTLYTCNCYTCGRVIANDFNYGAADPIGLHKCRQLSNNGSTGGF